MVLLMDCDISNVLDVYTQLSDNNSCVYFAKRLL